MSDYESEAQKVERRSPKPEDAGSIPATLANIGGSSNGRTAPFDGVNAGSTPAQASKPEPITDDVMEIAASIERDIPSRITGANRVFIRAVIARAIMAAKAEEREACAAYVEGKGGVIPGAAVFASLVSRNNQPCMSGDPRDRLHSHARRDFDDATDFLAAAIRSRGDK